LLDLGIAIASPIAGHVALYMALSAGHLEAIDSLKREQYVSGLSLGVVLGANKAKGTGILLS
jgi:hypothetical protein